jgi:hypothetical protein
MSTFARLLFCTCLGAILIAGCASTATEDCCAWAGLNARSLLGPDGKNCGTIQSHPLEPRAEQLRCVRHAIAHGVPYMITYHDTSKPGIETVEIAISSAQGEKVLMRRSEGGDAPQTYVGTCGEMSLAANGRIQRSNCTERAPHATG